MIFCFNIKRHCKRLLQIQNLHGVFKARLYTSRTRTRPTRTRTRTRLLSSFTIQIEHKRGKPSTDFESFTCLRYKTWSWNHGAGITKHREDHSYVFLRNIFLMSNLCLLCQATKNNRFLLGCRFKSRMFKKYQITYHVHTTRSAVFK